MPGSSSADLTSRMPLPPPPAVALTSNGKPIDGATARISSSRRLPSPSVPGTTGMPAAATVARAVALSPIAAMALGQEAVPGVDGACPALARHLDDLVPAQVRLARRRRAQQVGFVGQPHVQC